MPGHGAIGDVWGDGEVRAAPALLMPYVSRRVVTWLAERPAATTDLVDGTLVSADISGFTRLSELLATLGRAGAEELTDLLNGCFDRMIAACEELGGDVLKFGGDALLVLFTGDDHAARACLASAGMRASVVAPITTRQGGRLRLRMSVGAHSGTFSLFLVDGGHLELIVCGPAASTTVRCEAEAAAGQIMVSDSTARLLPHRWKSLPRPECG